MDKYKILVFQPLAASRYSDCLAENFSVTRITALDDCLALAAGDDYKVLVVDMAVDAQPDFSYCEALLKDEDLISVPLLLLSSSRSSEHKLKAFELGCDDYVEAGVSPAEVCARVNKSVYNRIANEQLKSRLQKANQTAFSAMADNSDLGSNILFLIEAIDCDNLDQLGQLFFTVIERYGLSCSLQMRSLYEVKNMDASGLARDLESQLLAQMRDAGRYIDFGRRTIVNHDRVSLLIRNMPEDKGRYGAVKDNSFALIRGMDARIKALDSQQKLIDEKKSLHRLSKEVKTVMSEIDRAYQSVMCDIVTVVEDMAEAVQNRIPVLALSEEQERFFEQTVCHCVMETNKVFNDGLKVDECFKSLSEGMDAALSQIDHGDDNDNDTGGRIARRGEDIQLF